MNFGVVAACAICDFGDMNADPSDAIFSADPKQSLFATVPGDSFANSVIVGLRQRLNDQPPELMGRVSIYANSARMRDKIIESAQYGPAGFVPRVRLLTDLPGDFKDGPFEKPASSLRRRLELRQMVARLVSQEPGLAPISAVADLSDSLFALIEEMADEGVSHSDIAGLDVSDESGHWERAQRFLSIVTAFLGPEAADQRGASEVLRVATKAIIKKWEGVAPCDPVLIVGTTGSRGTTSLILRAALKTENCAVILPGFDRDLPPEVWCSLANDQPDEDHPQQRYAMLLADVGVSSTDVRAWGPGVPKIIQDRNAILSLALRPAPVTNHWISESKTLGDVTAALSNVSLIEAPDPRHEALAIALAMREAVHRDQSVALITPDPDLTRMVSVALARWNITPDMSMGQPFGQSPPGRFMRQLLRLGTEKPEAEALISLLKHPLSHSGEARGIHLTLTRKLELWLRNNQVPFVDPSHLRRWQNHVDESGAERWATWLTETILREPLPRTANLAHFCERHFVMARQLTAGSEPGATEDQLWKEKAGDVLKTLHQDLTDAAPFGGRMTFVEYCSLFENLLKGREVRNVVTAHPRVMIWGTLESRVQTADRVILGGLNDGIWPESSAADPWLNRSLRQEAGLLSPERKTGLSAHDFQIAFGARDVILTLSLRADGTETVPSRWVNRLCNLLAGMSSEGKNALSKMRCSGAKWLDMCRQLEAPKATVEPELRPAPVVPVAARPRRLSITDIARMSTDPYAIYARKILRLEAIPSLYPRPDLRIKGNVLHSIVEKGLPAFDPTNERAEEERSFSELAASVFESSVPWVEARNLWQNRFETLIPDLLRQEAVRREAAGIVLTEKRATLTLVDRDVVLVCKADRIDQTMAGELILYDYKSGSIPSRTKVGTEEVQLLLEALMAEHGGFDELGPCSPHSVVYLSLKTGLDQTEVVLERGMLDQVQDELVSFLNAYLAEDFGFLSRRYPGDYEGDFDHLARFGEWADGSDICKADLS